MQIRFTDPCEFLRELRERGPDVEPVVRVTKLLRAYDQLPLARLFVVASYLRAAEHRGDTVLLVVLERFVGDVWPGHAERNRQILARADTLVSLVAEMTARAAYRPTGGAPEVRAGYYDDGAVGVAH